MLVRAAPAGAQNPTPCESSTITSASYLSARSQISFSGAMVPSMVNTPSVAIILNRALASPASKLRLEVRHIPIAIAIALRLAQANAVDDRSVVQFIGNDGILCAEQCLEQTAVRIETGRIEDGVFRAQEGGELRFQFLVGLLGAADETHGGHAIAPGFEAFACGRSDFADRLRGRDNCSRTY